MQEAREAMGESQRMHNEVVKVFIATRFPLFGDGIGAAIDKRPLLELVGTALDGEEAVRAVREHRPNVLVVDVKLGEGDGLAVIRRVSNEPVETRALVVSGELERGLIYDAISAGASGFLHKSADADSICDAIEAIAAGGTVWHPQAEEVLAGESAGREDNGGVLSPREVEILEMVADGLATTEIASRLYLSVATVKTHLHRTFRKLGVNDRAAAVAEAMRRGLFE